MNNGLQRKARIMDDNYQVNVWDVSNKIIVYVGNVDDCALFLGTTSWYARVMMKRKTVYKKKFTLRIKSTK